jgi:hypothetical protein
MNAPIDTIDMGYFSITIECSTGSEYDGRLGLRISAIFTIFIGSLLGCLVPIFLTRSSLFKIPKTAFFIAKYFGSGVIIGTAFIHLLAPAIEALTSPCLNRNDLITQYSWPEGICLMSIFAMFLAEILVSHYAMVGSRRKSKQKNAKLYSPSDFSVENGRIRYGGVDTGELNLRSCPSLNWLTHSSKFSSRRFGLFLTYSKGAR